MDEIKQRIEKLEFLIGSWGMRYNIPESSLSKSDIGNGIGVFKRILDDQYITFDYSAELTQGKAQAHGIFAWDDKIKLYRFSWFENSGNFNTAVCNFINDNTLFMKWQNSALTQTFTKIDVSKVILQMKNSVNKEDHELVMEVTFTRN